MKPIFRPIQGHAAPEMPTPRALGTALFVHRIKSQFKPETAKQMHVDGHPILKQPIVIRPAKPTHTSFTRLY